MRIPIDRNSQTPMYVQICQFIKTQIQSGALPPGTRLPASRILAQSLGVNRITVNNAYLELEAEGLVLTRIGSGTYVAPPLPDYSMPSGYTPVPDWPLWQQTLLNRTWIPAFRELDQMMASIHHPDLISFAGALGERTMFPVEDFRKALQLVIRRDGIDCLDYGERPGYLPLRETIAHILTSQGIPTRSEQILITNGSQQALHLTARLFLRPGDIVMVESPTYSGAIDLFRSLDVRLLGIPMDEEGMVADLVEDALHTAHPKLIYTIPNFQNPSGSCMSTVRRRQLLVLADRYNVPILEDDYVGDLRYEGNAQPALKALDPGGRVIYVSTFSKMLMPGLRVGYLVADGPVYEKLLDCKRANDLASSNLVQRALEAYISVGRYQAHLDKARRVYGSRRDAILAALEHYMPEGVTWRKPSGGLFLWLQLPDALPSTDLLPLAGEEGVVFTPGSLFFPCSREQPFLRINFPSNPPDRIELGVQRLAKAIRRLAERVKEGQSKSIHTTTAVSPTV